MLTSTEQPRVGSTQHPDTGPVIKSKNVLPQKCYFLNKPTHQVLLIHFHLASQFAG